MTPVITVTLPPANASLVLPAVTLTPPPTPHSASQTEIGMRPDEPLVAAPVDSNREPLVPLDVAPVSTLTLPLEPASDAPVDTYTPPLVEPVALAPAVLRLRAPVSLLTLPPVMTVTLPPANASLVLPAVTLDRQPAAEGASPASSGRLPDKPLMGAPGGRNRKPRAPRDGAALSTAPRAL